MMDDLTHEREEARRFAESLGTHTNGSGPNDGDAGTAARLGITRIDWKRFWLRDPLIETWTLEPIVPAGRQVALYSGPKLGKSLLGLDGVAAGVTGGSVYGQAPRAPIRVVYIDMEMTEDDLFERLSDLGYGPDTDLSLLAYYQLQALPPLDTDEGGAVVDEIVHDHQADLVVLDTMARVVEGDENNADTYRAFYRHTGRRLKQAGVGLWRFDHSGKDTTRGQRGSSSKADDVDVVFQATLIEGQVVIRRTHTRVPWVPAEVTLRREEEPVLRHVLGPAAWPAGTKDAADILDKLGVPLDATVNMASQALKTVEKGRRRTVIIAALKWRTLR
jgi:hypothetical protein